jgi:hypothetical protein
MKKLKIKNSISRFIKCHILCARSAFIEKNAMAALQDSFTDLSKFTFHFFFNLLIVSVFRLFLKISELHCHVCFAIFCFVDINNII